MSPSSAAPERPTVILAHPRPEMRAFLREQLAERYRVVATGWPREAWKQVRKEEPDVMIADAGLPDPGGRALCQKVKGAPGIGPVPTLLLAGGGAESSSPPESSGGSEQISEAPAEEDQALKESPKSPSSSESPDSASSLEPTGRPSDDFSFEGSRPAAGPDQRLEKPFSAAALLRQVGHLLGRTDAVETALRLIDRRLGDPALTVGDLAEAVDVSRRHLTRQFKEETGQAPAALLRQRRIEAAKRHLQAESSATEGGPIKEVAEAVGFRSPSHFSQVFREAVGQTPSAYRDRHASP